MTLSSQSTVTKAPVKSLKLGFREKIKVFDVDPESSFNSKV